MQHFARHTEIARLADDAVTTENRSAVIDALIEQGRTAEVFRLLTDAPSGHRDVIRARLECFVLQGDECAAADALRSNLSLVTDDRRMLRIARSIFDRIGDDRSEIADHFTIGRHPTAGAVERRLVALVELGFVEDALALWQQERRPELLGPHAAYAVAQALYARRDFGGSRSIIESLSGSVRHADSRKLIARIDFEQGDFAGSMARRLRDGYPTGQLDEVVYHAHLQLGERRTAMAMYCPDSDRERLAWSTSANSAGARNDHDCFVIAQSGPGDELQLASLYSRLRAEHERVAVTCDPRLEPLMRRSFPDLTVLPVARRARRHHWGFSAAGEPERASGDLSGLLTAEAAQHLARSGHAMLARQLPGRFLTDGSAPRSPGYLKADPDRCIEMARLLEICAPKLAGHARIGVVWRSELRDLMRQLHYLAVEDLGPILRMPHTFVCLQHDVEPAEVSAASLMAGENSFIVPNVDLRDDLDGAAALITGLDAVIGVGTTLTEMSGALGVPTVLIQPNHFGSWRSTDATGSDYWSASTRVATIRGVPASRYDTREVVPLLEAMVGIPERSQG